MNRPSRVACVCALVLVSGLAATWRRDPDRPTATRILIAALRSLPVDSLCHQCSVIVVDTAIRGARNSDGLAVQGLPVVEWAESHALRSLDANGHHFVPGGFRFGPLPRDSVRIAVEFVPPRLTMMDSGEVYMQVYLESKPYGYAVVARVQRVNGEWRAVVVRHMEG